MSPCKCLRVCFLPFMQLKVDLIKGTYHAECMIYAKHMTHAFQALLNFTRLVNCASHGLACNAGKRRLERQKGVRRLDTDIPYHQSCWAARLAESHRQMKPQACCTAGQDLHARDCLSCLCLCCDRRDVGKVVTDYTQPHMAGKGLTSSSLDLLKIPIETCARCC